MPYNHQQMAPYLYLGFLPVTVAQNRNQQGYRSNGVNYLFTNCDSNPNSYMAFYFNHNHHVALNYAGCCDSTLMHDWVTHGTAVPSSRYLPQEFYFFFELHMGGCGGYAIPPTIIHDVQGAALGLRFDYDNPCVPSPCQNGGSCYPNGGNQFICECSEGFTGTLCQNIA
ncbi:protocadherin Fat 4-like [Pecten maximus]|uniref:protocadherin Fat 4-like n=1 Tax=Pecten maximus TaxID=6579 RepID=UPI0014588AE3|nr:protocadherin Fat 4-like [Pecten maximus]